jgi:hypothetical protein
MFRKRYYLASTALMLLLLAAALWSTVPSHAVEDVAAPPAAAPESASLEQQKTAALAWINQYLSRQVLLSDEYVGKLRTAVEKMSPEETQQWLKQTAEMRALLDSKEWKDTEEWLRGFLSVQTIYSEKEIEELRDKASQMSPGQLLELMKQIREKHLTLQNARPDATPSQTPSFADQRAAFERRRQFELQQGNQVKKEQTRPAATGPAASFGGSSGSAAGQYNAIINAKIRSVPSPSRGYGYGGRW